jgi:predicted kinase
MNGKLWRLPWRKKDGMLFLKKSFIDNKMHKSKLLNIIENGPERVAFIMQGLPGSGKSSFISLYFHPNDYVKCSSDDYHMVGDKYRFVPSNAGKAHAECLKKWIEEVRNTSGTKHIICDNTNLSRVEQAPYVNSATAYQVPVIVLVIKTSVSDSLKRNTHGVPLEVIQAMASKQEYPLPYWGCTVYDIELGSNGSLLRAEEWQ